MFPFAQMSPYGNEVVITEKIKKIIPGENSFYVLYNNGNLWALGQNAYGQFGIGEAANTTVKGWTLIKTGVDNFYGGDNGSIIKLTTGAFQYAGWQRVIGGGDTATTTWTTATAYNYFATNSLTIKDMLVISGVNHVRDTNNNLYSMGYSNTGGLGRSGTATVFALAASDVQYYGLGALTPIIIKSDGIMYHSGWNQYGQQGTGNTTNISVFTSSGISGIKAMKFAAHSNMYIGADNLLYGTGERTLGQLTGTNTANLTTYTNITSGLPADFASYDQSTAGYDHYNIQQSYRWTVGSDIYATGTNAAGQLGIGTSTNATTFTKMVLPVPVSQIREITGPYLASYMLCTQNRLYGCGTAAYLPGYTTNQTTMVPITLPE